MMGLLEEVTEEVERIRREYPTPPVRYEIAPDVYDDLLRLLPSPPPGEEPWFAVFRRTPVRVNPLLAPGEWGPVYTMRRRQEVP